MEILVNETTGLLHSAGKVGVTSLAEVSHQKAYVLRQRRAYSVLKKAFALGPRLI